MRLIKLFPILISVIFSSGYVSASVSLSMGFYNSEDTLSVGLAGEGFEFDASTVLMPDSLLYINGGSSNSPDGQYSYEVSLNGKPLGSGARTDSGSFGWSTYVNHNAGGDDSTTFIHTMKSDVKNGELITYFSNPYNEVDQTIHTDDTAYSQKGMASADTMAISGAGETLGTSQDNEMPTGNEQTGESHPGRGMKGMMSITGPEDSAAIACNIYGDTDLQWRDAFTSCPTEYTLSRAAKGVMHNSDADGNRLQMIGGATGFPTQILPAGEISITYQSTYLLEAEARIDDAINDFKEKYPGPYTPALTYYLNEKCIVSPKFDYGSDQSKDPIEIYKMLMQFRVR